MWVVDRTWQLGPLLDWSSLPTLTQCKKEHSGAMPKWEWVPPPHPWNVWLIQTSYPWITKEGSFGMKTAETVFQDPLESPMPVRLSIEDRFWRFSNLVICLMAGREESWAGKVGPDDGGRGLMKARKKFGALRGEIEKGKHDDHPAERVFQISTSKCSTSVGLFKRTSLEEVLYHLLIFLLLKIL